MHLHTTTQGEGPLRVALVHGLGGDAGTWFPLVERMTRSGRYTVTAVDLRGHGRSERAASYALAPMADDLVESLPTGLDAVVGHSLGGAVVARAVERLRPAHAIYLDPGFALALPTTGLSGRLFWAAPLLTLGVAQLGQARRSAKARAAYSPRTRAALAEAQQRFDRSMALGVFREVAFHPVPVAAPAVPSTIVLSDDSPAVVPDAYARELEGRGWQLRRLAGVHHDMHLEDPDRTFAVVDEIL